MAANISGMLSVSFVMDVILICLPSLPSTQSRTQQINIHCAGCILSEPKESGWQAGWKPLVFRIGAESPISIEVPFSMASVFTYYTLGAYKK
jgi:hypothetical protein